jgi:hypothetical protein
MFRDEYYTREKPGKKTLLEQLTLSENDFTIIADILHVLEPFKVAQEALEGENYVNLSLLPLIIWKLKNALHTNLGAINDVEQPQFYNVLSDMVDDFETRWGDELRYSGLTQRAERGRITGVPKLAFWASMLDPRTKHGTMKILTAADRRDIWEDIRDEIIAIRQREAPIGVDDNIVQNNERAATAARTLPAARTPKNNKGGLTVASFMCDDTISGEEDSVAEDDATLKSIDGQIERYKAEQFKLIDKVTGKYNCPLLWWSEHSTMYPDIWKLAERILHIPATSAPAERVFSVASNVINNKRARLAPDNANVLIFLHDNAEFC